MLKIVLTTLTAGLLVRSLAHGYSNTPAHTWHQLAIPRTAQIPLFHSHLFWILWHTNTVPAASWQSPRGTCLLFGSFRVSGGYWNPLTLQDRCCSHQKTIQLGDTHLQLSHSFIHAQFLHPTVPSTLFGCLYALLTLQPRCQSSHL